MTTPEEAAAQLKTIRSLMERATIFRALSAEAALVGGATSLLAGWLSEPKRGWAWASIWLVGLAAAVLFMLWQLLRTSHSHQKPLFPRGLQIALRGALPSLIAGGFLGLLPIRYGIHNGELQAACFWILHYGLALLAIRESAPPSMTWLGLAFASSGLASFAAFTFIQAAQPILLRLGPSGLMATTFGGFHLLYGIALVSTSRRDPHHP